MSRSHSITVWLDRLKDGDARACQALWERFFARMVAVARGRLRSAPRRAADEADVAVEAFLAFHRAVQADRLPRLHDREDLWACLLSLTLRKAADQARHEGRQKRGGGEVRGDSVLRPEEEGVGLEPCDDGLSPDEEVAVAEEVERLLGILSDAELRRLAVLKMEGYTNGEIAERLGCALATVERRLQVIRKTWKVAEG